MIGRNVPQGLEFANEKAYYCEVSASFVLIHCESKKTHTVRDRQTNDVNNVDCFFF